jgi:phage baseplate assembly protein W
MTRTDYFDFPFRVDGRGRTAETGEDDHDFGCGISQLVFQPASTSLAAATQFLVQGALTRWLDTVIAVQRVDVIAEDSALKVKVVFTKRSTGEERTAEFLSPWRV